MADEAALDRPSISNRQSAISNSQYLSTAWISTSVSFARPFSATSSIRTTTPTTTFNQSFTYDHLNRLSTATDSGPWSQTYDYDIWGNRGVRAGSYMPASRQTPTSNTSSDHGLPQLFNQSNNRVIATAEYGYDQAGNLVKSWGGPGKGYDWPSAEHGISADYKGNLWLTGSGPSGGGPGATQDNMILKFSRDGKFLLQVGGRNQPGGNKDTKNFERATDIDVYKKTNEAFISDGYGNRRVIVLDADTGAFKRMWGAFGRPPDDDPPAPARPAAAPGGAAPAAAAAPPSTPEGSPRFANPVHGIKVSNDGMVYVCDRTNRRIQVFGVDGKYVNQVFINRSEAVSAAGLAFSGDPQQTYLYVADYGNSHVVVVNRKTLEVLYQFGKRSPTPGDFQGIHNLATDSKGNLYTAEVAPGNRAQRFVLKGISAPPTTP